MMLDDAKNALVESNDSKASILAAIARVEAVPAGRTLIDEIDDQEWLDDGSASLIIEAGSDATGDCDELDDSDKEVVQVC